MRRNDVRHTNQCVPFCFQTIEDKGEVDERKITTIQTLDHFSDNFIEKLRGMEMISGQLFDRDHISQAYLF